jgi:polysaccharide deacetylase 2 family uncharacterized protein YibQ
MADDLSAPLVRRRDRIRRAIGLGKPGGVRWPIGRLLLALILLVVCGLALRILIGNDPGGGRPVAEAPIQSTLGGNTVAKAVSAPATGPVTITPGPEIPAAKVAGDGPAITTVPDAGASTDASDPSRLDPDLVEQSKDGPLPRMSADGRTAFATYAAPFDPAAVAGKPMIAIVVTGLGLSQSGTMDAISALPGPVSLAFAPYGKTLDKTVPAARTAGHEVLLEVPLEPFDYPDNDPGPETLLTGQPTRANLDRLYWLMARFGGYIGLTNYMGARFTSSAADFSPIMEELATRGLGYLDDGSSNRSVAPQLADKAEVPFARATLTLDTDPAKAPILDALSRLEDDARKTGSAIGMISALPVSVETVSDWTHTLDSKGLTLVPVSALMK